MIQYQILKTNITRTKWHTVRRITSEILGVKGSEFLPEISFIFTHVHFVFVFILQPKGVIICISVDRKSEILTIWT